MKHLIARLKYLFTGKTDPMNLLNGVYLQNLPKRLTISRGMLKSTHLAYEAGDLVATLYQNDDSDDFEFAKTLRSLPKHWGTLETLMYYDAMVNNGGHKQYFENSRGAYLDLVEDGLRLYAASYHLEIFQRALFRYDPQLQAAHADLDTAPPPKENAYSRYDDLDTLYYRAKPALAELADQYIRTNLKLFQQ